VPAGSTTAPKRGLSLRAPGDIGGIGRLIADVFSPQIVALAAPGTDEAKTPRPEKRLQLATAGSAATPRLIQSAGSSASGHPTRQGCQRGPRKPASKTGAESQNRKRDLFFMPSEAPSATPASRTPLPDDRAPIPLIACQQGLTCFRPPFHTKKPGARSDKPPHIAATVYDKSPTHGRQAARKKADRRREDRPLPTEEKGETRPGKKQAAARRSQRPYVQAK